MREPRLFVAQPLTPGSEVELDDRSRRHVSQVLRLRIGHQVILFDGSGTDFAAELTHCDRVCCRARIDGVRSTEATASLPIGLAVGISRGERMDFVVQKSVELGVATIWRLTTERSIVQMDAQRRDKRMAHWRGILIGACEQSGRSRLPVLHEPTGLAEWLEAHPQGLMLHHGAQTGLHALPAPTTPIHLLVGPEGGLSDAECTLAERHHYIAVRLGPRILRTETAPLAAIAAIQTLWGDFR